MAIRIGSSCVISQPMAIGKVVETRRFYDGISDWQAVSRNAIKTKQYLIVTPCNHNDKVIKYNPPYITDTSNTQWTDFIDDTCKYLISIGANRNNCRISLINEPMKYITRERYAELINLAYPVIKKYNLLCGAGNEEFITAAAKGNMYQYILSNCDFDILDLHIQASCSNQQQIDKYEAEVQSWVNFWQKPVDCTEAFYDDIATGKGWHLLLAQLQMALDLKCENFCMVFSNLDQKAFVHQPTTEHWKKLAFKVNGILRSNYWAHWKILTNTYAPVPNIIETIEELEDMKLTYLKIGSKGNQVKWLQDILFNDYQILNAGGIDGKFGPQTDQQVRDYQEEKGIKIDGIVGEQTTMKLINESSDPKKWMRNLEIYMAYE